MPPYQRPVTSRCYVTTFRNTCDAFVELIDQELEDTLKKLHIHQFLKFPAFQQCIPLLYEILKYWSSADEGFIVNCHLLKFTTDEVALLTGLPNRGAEIKWRSDPTTGLLSTAIKTEMSKLNRAADNATKLRTFLLYLLSNLFFPLNNHKTPRMIISITNNVNEFASINWAASIREFMVQEFDKIRTKLDMEKPLGYINGFLPLLLIWFLEHYTIITPSHPDLRPRFLRWENNTDIYYTQESAMTLFKYLKNNEIYLVLQNVSNEEAEELGADINSIRNTEIRNDQALQKISSPQPKKVRVHTPPRSPQQEPSPKHSPIHPPAKSTSPKGENWATLHDKLLVVLQNMCNKIEQKIETRFEQIEENLENLETNFDSLRYKFIHHLAQCNFDPDKPSISTSTSSVPSIRKPKKFVPPSKKSLPIPKKSLPPPNKDDSPQPPKQPRRLKRVRDEKDVISVEKIQITPRPAQPVMEYPGKDLITTEQQNFLDECFRNFPDKTNLIFESGNIAISRADIDDLLTNQCLGDHLVDAFACLLSQKSQILKEKFQPYIYISPLYRVYKEYNHPSKMFIEHITPASMRESNLIVQPIIFGQHWILLIGRLKEKMWKLYDSLPNPQHKNICNTVIKYLHDDLKGTFSSDITKWSLQTIRGIPTQTNEVDCGMFVCKYMEKAIEREKVDWALYKDWQKYMPKFRAEFAYYLYLNTKK